MKKGERNCKELNEIGEIHWYIYILFRTLVLTHPTFCGNSKENVADTLPFLFFFIFRGGKRLLCNILPADAMSCLLLKLSSYIPLHMTLSNL